jgi:hypothetical protein
MALNILTRKSFDPDMADIIVSGKKFDFNPLQNKTVPHLNIGTNTMSSKWEFADMREWDKNIGRGLLVR